MKEKMHFEITINAPVQKVWDTMLKQDTYREWTSVFDPTSYYEGTWEKGSKIKFLSTEGGGMLSEIAENDPLKFISIRHLGELKQSIEDASSEKSAMWDQAFENYTFTEKGTETLLQVDLEMPSTPESKAMMEMFQGMWPKALLKLKEICEK